MPSPRTSSENTVGWQWELHFIKVDSKVDIKVDRKYTYIKLSDTKLSCKTQN